MNKLTFIDMFAGIGGFHSGFEKAGMQAKGWIEWDKFARKSYSTIYNVDGLYNGKDIQKAKGQDLPQADLWSFGSPCFVAGTLVQTKKGLLPIENITTNDEVVTIDGSYQKVTDTMVHTSDNIFELKVEGNLPIQATGNHPIYAKKRHERTTANGIEYEYDASKWIALKDLSIGDLVVNYSPTKKPSAGKTITDEEIELLGCYLADKTKTDKKEIATWLYDIPFEQQKLFVNSFISHLQHTVENNNVIVTIINQKLALSFSKFIENVFGITTNLSNNGKEYTVQYVLPKQLAKNDFTFWKPVTGVKKLQVNTPVSVYNLEVENNHTYNANGIIVHNCTNLSVAGKRAGIQGNESRMFFEVMRLLDEANYKPKYLIMENVKGLLSSHNGADFKLVKEEFDKHGYDVEYQVLNSKVVVPQNRERIYIVGHLKNLDYKPIFPISDDELSKFRQHTYLDEILENNVDSKYYLNKDKLLQLLENDNKHTFVPKNGGLKVVGNIMKSGFYNGRVFNPTQGIAPTLTTMKGGNRQPKVIGVYATISPDRIHKRQNGRRFKQVNEPSFTLTRSDHHGVAIQYINLDDEHQNIPVIQLNDNTYLAVRKLTPLECWRLQGFSDKQFYKAKDAGISDSQLYNQAGNAVSVPVINCIANKLLKLNE